MNGSSKATGEDFARSTLISGYNMVELDSKEFRFLWGLALLVLFQGQNPVVGKQIIPLGLANNKSSIDSPVDETNLLSLKLHEIVLPVLQFLSAERFFKTGFFTLDICIELLQVVPHLHPLSFISG